MLPDGFFLRFFPAGHETITSGALLVEMDEY